MTQGSNPRLLCLLHWQVDSLAAHPSGKSYPTITFQTRNSSVGKESACSAGDPGSTPRSGRSEYIYKTNRKTVKINFFYLLLFLFFFFFPPREAVYKHSTGYIPHLLICGEKAGSPQINRVGHRTDHQEQSPSKKLGLHG